VADVREELLATLAALSDFAYGWGALDAYLPRLHAQVPGPPSCMHACLGVSAALPFRALLQGQGELQPDGRGLHPARIPGGLLLGGGSCTWKM
jgi:hypothetical protein